MNDIKLGSIVEVLEHDDPTLIGQRGRVTAVTGPSVSVQLDLKKTETRQFPISLLLRVGGA